MTRFRKKEIKMETKVFVHKKDFKKAVANFVKSASAWTDENNDSILFHEGLYFSMADNDEEYVFIIKKVSENK